MSQGLAQLRVNKNYHYAPLVTDHSTSISACGVWGARAGIQVFKMEFHTYTLRLS